MAVDRDAVIQFTDEWIRQCMQLLPELQDVDEVLKLSTRGLVFSGATAWRAAEEITSVVHTHGPERVGHLFKLLGLMAHAPGRASGRRWPASGWAAPTTTAPAAPARPASTTSSPTSPATSG